VSGRFVCAARARPADPSAEARRRLARDFITLILGQLGLALSGRPPSSMKPVVDWAASQLRATAWRVRDPESPAARAEMQRTAEKVLARLASETPAIRA
jgi:hypothetical protein